MEMRALRVSALVLAAGQSRRMGRPKMTLPWGKTTVIGRVVLNLMEAGLQEIVVVTGGDRQAVEAALRDLPVCLVFNPDHAAGEMLSSVQVGLRALSAQARAALIVLGDQPMVPPQVIRAVAAHDLLQARLVIPSYQRRRGHPWLLRRDLWPEVLALQPPQTLRDFLDAHAAEIYYLNVGTEAVIQDLDTPADYEKFHLNSD